MFVQYDVTLLDFKTVEKLKCHICEILLFVKVAFKHLRYDVIWHKNDSFYGQL